MKKVFLYAIIGLILIAAFLPGLVKLQQLKEKNRILGERIEVLTKYNAELRNELDRLQNDPSYIERIAREKLGMVKKGEVLYRIRPEAPKEKE